MNEAQHKNLAAAVVGCARAVGAELAADKPEPIQYAEGLAFLVARIMRSPQNVRYMAARALEHLDAMEEAKGAV